LLSHWVTLGIIVQLACRPDRYFCLNVLWRIAERRGNKTRKEHRTKPQLAAEMIQILAAWLPDYQFYVVGDMPVPFVASLAA
jgi:hypothetical protein